MLLPMTPRYQAAILRQYDRNLSRYPLVRREAEAFLQDREEEFSLCMKYLYGHMAAQDVLSFPVSLFGEYVNATLQALTRIDYLRSVPPEIFFPYVLQHRVNSECLDDSRSFLFTELLPYVQGKSMEQAALAVNYWCYAHATYTPADDRTLGPLAVIRRTLGRCGEESVLAVAALRSVGIPARQCYCPRWSHCDDNHAWVEVWIHGSWHYMGACEPEPVLDRGWFTAAASRAMLVDTKCWATDALYETVNCTPRYADTRSLTVQVTENATPVPNARVCFQIINYSELFTLWEAVTDQKGLACFETGAGDLMVFARHDRKVALQKVDLRQQNAVTLALETAFPEQLTADLVPPEDRSGAVPVQICAHHTQLLKQCESYLAARRATFSDDRTLFRHAALNGPRLRKFWDDDRFPRHHKTELMNTLRPKDFADITCETLTDALETANQARGKYSAEIFRNYILSPRIADEMLLPERLPIRSLFPDGFEAPGDILAWMQTHMELLPDEGVSHFFPSALGCLRCRQVPAFAFDAVFVALCRSFGFPARLEPHTGRAQWLNGQDLWQDIHPAKPPVQLTLEIPAGKKLQYYTHFTLGQWNGSQFITLYYPGLTLEKSHSLRLQPGLYRITVTTRQIDGTVSAVIRHLTLESDTTLRLTPPEDQTHRRLKQLPLQLPEGPLQKLIRRDSDKNLLLIFADPGSEPTEHLLGEMAQCAEDFQKLPTRILLLAQTAEALAHPTVKLLKTVLPDVELAVQQDPDGLAALYRQMQTGDLRLPFSVCIDRHGRGIYAAANYQIRMAQTLLAIQKLMARHD